MLRRLRWRLTALYTLAGLVLSLSLGGGVYGLLRYYFRVTTDQALYHRMAHDIAELGLPLSAELIAADQDWYAQHGKTAASFAATDTTTAVTSTLWSGYQPFAQIKNREELEEYYDGEIAAMFVFPLDGAGRLIFDPNPVTGRHSPHQGAVAAARVAGRDLRTIDLSTGERARLLTYQLVRRDEIGFLQIGRVLTDQDRVLEYLLLTFLGVGGVAMVAIGAGSWWLAGRSIRPVQRAWSQQQTFIANASHELRTPLTLLRASLEVIQSDWPSAQPFGQRILQDALAECDHMSQLVTDLLTLARLDEGRLQLRAEPVAVAELLLDIQRKMKPLAQERAIDLQVQASSSLTLITDPLRLRQVILIALDNALQHTPAGGQVDLIAGVEQQKVRITVQDTGGGIAPEHLPHLFERFYRINATPTPENKGSGLGLSIAAGLVKAMRGEITLQSQVGHGTQVVLQLPQQLPGA